MRRRGAGLVVMAALAAGCVEERDVGGDDGGPGAGDAGVHHDGAFAGEGGDAAGGAGGAATGGAAGGGFGGAGCAGGAGGFVGAGGASGGSGGETVCDRACARLVDCSVERCEGFEAADRGTIEGLCRAACDANPSFAVVADGTETCDDLVAFARQSVAGGYADRCPAGPGGVRPHPECDVFGRRVAECVAERCPPARETVELFAATYTDFCNQSVARGETDPVELGRLIGENTPCDAPLLAQIVEGQLVDTPERDNDGLLAPFCAEGPLTPPETCAAACERVGPCVPPDDAGNGYLRDPARCAHLCTAFPNPPPAAWACVAALEEDACVDVYACFAPQPVAACEPFAARVAACVVEVCAPLDPVRPGLEGQIRAACDQRVNDGALAEDQVAAVGPETPCDDPLVGVVRDEVVGPNTPFGPRCEEGLLRDHETCRRACEHLGPCIPADGDGAALRDAATCELYCATSPDVADQVWTCLDRAAGGCPQVYTCFP